MFKNGKLSKFAFSFTLIFFNVSVVYCYGEIQLFFSRYFMRIVLKVTITAYIKFLYPKVEKSKKNRSKIFADHRKKFAKVKKNTKRIKNFKKCFTKNMVPYIFTLHTVCKWYHFFSKTTCKNLNAITPLNILCHCTVSCAYWLCQEKL